MPPKVREIEEPLLEGDAGGDAGGGLGQPRADGLVPMEEEAPAEERAAKKGLSWPAVSAFMVSIILGLGVLGIPEAFAQLGWILGFFIMAAVALGAVYVSVIIVCCLYCAGQ